MKSSFLKKAAAIACGAITIATMSVAAFTASADGTSMVADKITLDAPTTEAVKYTVKLQGNPGVTNINFTLKFDNRLTAVVEHDDDENKDLLKFETGYAGMASAFVNEDATDEESGEKLGAIIGCGIVGSSKMTGDNDVLTVWFKLPSDAKAGDKYEISFYDKATEFLNGRNAVDVSGEAGYIEIATPTTTEETTTTTEETTTTTEETTTSAETTASSTEAETGTTTTSASDDGTGSTTTTTTTTAKTTTKNNGGNGTTNNGGKQDGPTAGDAGVALALAGLLAAAGTAIVARKKQ